jgi:hypothetical protein
MRDTDTALAAHPHPVTIHATSRLAAATVLRDERDEGGEESHGVSISGLTGRGNVSEEIVSPGVDVERSRLQAPPTLPIPPDLPLEPLPSHLGLGWRR